jgi:hypothetical protein
MLAEYRKKFPVQQHQCYPPTKRPSASVISEPQQPATSSSVSAASQFASRITQPWVLDLGASFHVTSDRSQLVSCQPMKGASVLSLIMFCHSSGPLSTSEFSVPNISFVPQLSMSLMSVGQIVDMDYFVGFNKISYYVQDL